MIPNDDRRDRSRRFEESNRRDFDESSRFGGSRGDQDRSDRYSGSRESEGSGGYGSSWGQTGGRGEYGSSQGRDAGSWSDSGRSDPTEGWRRQGSGWDRGSESNVQGNVGSRRGQYEGDTRRAIRDRDYGAEDPSIQRWEGEGGGSAGRGTRPYMGSGGYSDTMPYGRQGESHGSSFGGSYGGSYGSSGGRGGYDRGAGEGYGGYASGQSQGAYGGGRGESGYGGSWSGGQGTQYRGVSDGGGRYGGQGSSGGYGSEGGGSGSSSRGSQGWSGAQGGGMGSSGGRSSHRGKGPKGYQRTDSRIEEEINERLAEDDDVDAEGIEVKVKDGEVTLSGTCESREARRRAEDIAESILGVKHVSCNLRTSGGSRGREMEKNNVDDTSSGARFPTPNLGASSAGVGSQIGAPNASLGSTAKSKSATSS